MTDKKQYGRDKKAKDLYKVDANIGESYSDFKRRVKKQLGC